MIVCSLDESIAEPRRLDWRPRDIRGEAALSRTPAAVYRRYRARRIGSL